MADNDSKLPTRTTALDSTTEVANASGVTINPAKEDGNLATVAAWDNGGKAKVDLQTVGGVAITEGQKAMSASLPVVIASDQSAIPVNVQENNIAELFNYNTASAVVAAASNTHSFTPGSTVYIESFEMAASGQAKWEIQWGTTGSETSKFVKFTSKSSQSVSVRLPNPVQITTAMTVKIIRTNSEPALAQDLYSTIAYH